MEMIYVIYEMSNMGNINFSEVVENQQDTLRLSMDGTNTILKFQGSTPDFLEGIAAYTQQQILTIIRNPINGWVE